ncbi:hypothetical protein KI387_026130 [Taxus chinensis]|uniref:HD-Zip IV C-terminal domain-containing protein n=1 Tax=Taxus chinensis TaxID=29808 RepID=A0AA38FW23_TAXCH|nr:hypothetical protein KI387_026130 [Taxus chinensis]
MAIPSSRRRTHSPLGTECLALLPISLKSRGSRLLTKLEFLLPFSVLTSIGIGIALAKNLFVFGGTYHINVIEWFLWKSRLAQRRMSSLCSNVKQNRFHVATRKSADPGQPSDVVLCVATSLWVPVRPHRVFDFFRDEQMRAELLLTVVIVEGAVALFRMVNVPPVRKLTIKSLDGVKMGKGPAMVKTLVDTLCMIMEFSIASILKIQNRAIKMAIITPTDQILM